jgi:calcineurin-like phosphoesterase family protein
MRFYTSDSHIWHRNIIRHCNRPFASVEEMNETLTERWNAVVSPFDTVIRLGDVGMGWKPQTAEVVEQLNGYKVLIPGNHDEVSSVAGAARRERFLSRYLEVFDEVWDETESGYPIADWEVRLCHYPSQGDSRDYDRHVHLRPPDDGMPLLHGHTHSHEKISGPRAFHVGVDAHNFTPVPEEEIVAWLETLT